MIRAYANYDNSYLAIYPELDRQEEIFIATTGTITSPEPPLHWRIVWRAYALQNGQHFHAGWKCVEIVYDETLNRDPKAFSFRFSFRALNGTCQDWMRYSVGWLDREFRDNLVQLAAMLPQPKATGGNCLTCIVQSLFNVIEEAGARYGKGLRRENVMRGIQNASRGCHMDPDMLLNFATYSGSAPSLWPAPANT